MMAVVVIVTILGALAIPSVRRQLRDRATYEAALRVSVIYQNARMRAMGRGSAILVRFQRGAGEKARYDVLEAQRGTTDAPSGTSNAACAALPIPSCLATNWDAPAANNYRVVSQTRFGTTGEYDDLDITMANSSDVAADALDICFTPMGRAFARTTAGLQPLTEAYTASFFLGTSFATSLGRTFRVLILPSGATRILQ